MTFSLCVAQVRGNAKNIRYPNVIEITNIDTLRQAISFDHVGALFQDNIRGNDRFILSNCVVMDIDNDHSEQAEDWVRPTQFATYFPNILCFTVTSKNHNREKNGKTARPRFHAYFPIPTVFDANEYANIKKEIATKIELFDKAATDSARFIFGNPEAEIEQFTGSQTILDWLEERREQERFEEFDTGTTLISSGERNSTLSRFAGKVLIRYGDSEKARELFKKKAALCNPPLPVAELKQIWASARKFGARVQQNPEYVPPEQYTTPPVQPVEYSDTAQGEMFANMYREQVRFCPSTGWLTFNGGVWKENELLVQQFAMELTKMQLAEADQQIQEANLGFAACGGYAIIQHASSDRAALKQMSEEQREQFQLLRAATEYKKYAIGRGSFRSVEASLKAARPALHVDVSELDTHPYLLNTPAGVVDLRKGLESLQPVDCEYLITQQTDVSPSVSGAGLWEEALNTFFMHDQALIDYVQQVCGLIAIGEIKLEALIIAYGGGRNGKSTFWNTIAAALGSYAGRISADVITAGTSRNIKPELAEARGKRFLLAAELEEGARLSTSVLKQLASTDEIVAEKKFFPPFAFTPSHTMVLCTNYLPKVAATDRGTWRRLIVIPFQAQIPEQNDIKNYAQFLKENALEAVLAWIIEGAKRIHAANYHLAVPKQVQNASDTYRSSYDWLKDFIEECCETSKEFEQKAGELYQAYRGWAFARGDHPLHVKDFNTEFERAGYKRIMRRSGKHVLGVRLISEINEPAESEEEGNSNGWGAAF